jgi:hypothetical protein
VTEQLPEADISTGDARVDAVVDRLEAVDELSLAEQPAVFAHMQADLAAVLDGEEDPDPPGGG